MLKDRAEKTKGLFEGIGAKENINDNTDTDININANVDVNSSDNVDANINKASDFSQLLSGKQSEEMVMKGLYLRKDQVTSLERYSKMANKSYSEFVRDALDIVFSELEKAQQ